MTDREPAAWWAALEAHGLDHLSAPELAHALQELAHDRPAFLEVLAAANDYPRVGLCRVRRPDRAEIARLDRDLPRARAVLLPEDEMGIRMARGAFEMLLVLDPLWNTGDLFYASWHAAEGILPEHAQRLHHKLAPAVRLSGAREALRFIPDHIPGSWDPFPSGSGMPLRRAAGLLYWANCLRGVAVAGLSEVAVALRDLARAGPDLQGGGGAEILVSPAAGSSHHAWEETFDAVDDDPTPLVPLLGRAGDAGDWRLGVGARALPDVSLAMLRAQAGRSPRSGLPGRPFALARRPVYLVPA